MNPRLRIESEASQELEEAALWYDDQRPELGTEFLDSVGATLNRIAKWPQAGSPVPDLPDDLRVRRVPIGRFPYHVLYLTTPDAVRILAFAHDHRMPRYWSSRIHR